MKYDVVVIGAGASGMMAAIQAAKKSSEEGTGGCIRVALLEVLARPGKKILATGNGKCNLTNYKLMIAVITRTVAVLRIYWE